MTMGDHIRSMTDKELSKFIADLMWSIPESDDKNVFIEGMEQILGEEEE